MIFINWFPLPITLNNSINHQNITRLVFGDYPCQLHYCSCDLDHKHKDGTPMMYFVKYTMVVFIVDRKEVLRRHLGFRLSAPQCSSFRLAGTLVCLLALSQWSGQVQGRQTCNLRLSSAADIIPHRYQPLQSSTNSPCSVMRVISAAVCFVLHHLFLAVSASLHAHAKYLPTRPKLALRSFACCMSSDWEDSENRFRVREHEWYRRISFNLSETIVPAVRDMNPSSQLSNMH